jgi:hypothetical protein
MQAVRDNHPYSLHYCFSDQFYLIRFVTIAIIIKTMIMTE